MCIPAAHPVAFEAAIAKPGRVPAHVALYKDVLQD